MGTQRLGTIGTDCIVSEVKVLEGRELGQVGPQRLGTIGTDCIESKVKVLEGREVGQVGPHLAQLTSLQHLDLSDNSIGDDGAESLGLL